MYFKRPPHPARLDLLCLAILTTMNCAHPVAPPAEPLVPRNPIAPAPAPPEVVIAEAPRAVPLDIMAGAVEPLRADDPTLPDEVQAAARGKTLDGAYKLCISTTGSVQTVTPVVSIAGADSAIISTLRTWKFPELPVEICKVQTFSFDVP